MDKHIKNILISEQEIKEIVSRLAGRIEEDYKDKNLLLVGLLKGSAVFMSDLMRQIKIPCKIDFMVTSSYGDSTVSSGRLNILKDLSAPIDGMDVLVIEDIIDSGVTLSFILEYLKAKNAKSVKICTLLDKPDRRVKPVKVDYTGRVIPDEFVVGYGLDYAELYRNLPYVGVLKSEVYS
ncbi:MAG: hypoxanthine phosphoribosyltransferase [Acutalibacteraceae bacterium]